MFQIAFRLGLISTMLIVLRPANGQDQPIPQALDVNSWPAGVAIKSTLPTEGVVEYGFEEVQASDINGWLAWVGVEMPVDVSGSLTGWLWAQRGNRGWLNFSEYRIEGQITSPNLRIDRWEFRQADLRFGYANDRWYVGRLAGEVAAVGSPQSLGRTEFAATMGQRSPRRLDLSGTIDQTRIEALLNAFGVDFTVVNEAASVTAAASVPWEAVDVPSAWRATAKLDVQGVQAERIPRSGLTAQLSARDGAWQMSDATLTVIDQTINLSGQGKLEPRLPFTASWDGRSLSMTELLEAGQQSSLASRLVGSIDVVGTLRGDAEHGLESASAAVRSKRIRIDGEELQGVLIESVLDNRSAGAESLAIEIKSAAIAGGSLRGTVRWARLQALLGLVPDIAQVYVSEVDLSQLPHTLVPFSMLGNASGQVEFTVARDEAGIPLRWAVDGDLTTTQTAVEGTSFGDAELVFDKALDSDKLQVHLNAAAGAVQAKADVYLQVAGGFPGTVRNYDATANVKRFQTQLALPFSDSHVPLSITGHLVLGGESTKWPNHGNAELSQLRIQLDEQTLELNDVLFNVRDDAFRLERFTLRDATGRVAGSALLRRDGRGEHLLNLRVVGVELEPYLKQFAPPELQGIQGTLGFESRLRKAVATDLLSDWSGTFKGAVEELEYRSTPLGQLVIGGAVSESQISGTAQGNVLGGDMRLSGEVGADDWWTGGNIGNAAKFTAILNAVQLDRLMSVVSGPRLGKRYAGTANISVEAGVGELEQGLHMHLQVPSFAYERQEIAKDLFAELLFVDGILLVKEVRGGLASGRVELAGELQLAESQREGALQFTVNGAQLNGIAALLFPEYADNYAGVVTYRGRAQLGDEITLVGKAHVTDVFMYEIPIQEVRSDVAVSLSALGELLLVTARNAHGTALGGRFDGEAVLRGGARYELAAQGKIGRGKLEQLSRALGFEHIVGTGRFNAATRLSSADALNLAALNGPLQLDFEGGDAQSVPLLSDIGHFVPIIQVASTDITSGTMHGQLGQGQLRINDLLLNSNAYWLVAKGSASLTSQRLDFEAILQTGGGLDDRLLQSGSQKLLALALPQLALLTELNDLISNRTLYFNIGGTTKHPVIQPRAAQTAAKALVQNVARQLLVVPPATSGQQ
ncbi:MAG: AsmA-like C-terminal region-containing protein [Pirellulaceae bacterium]